MSRKERFDAARSLADFQLNRVAARHAVIWRLTFSAWAVPLAAIATGRITLKSTLLGPLLIAIGITFTILILVAWAQNAQQARQAYYYADKAEHLMMGQVFLSSKPKQFREILFRDKLILMRESFVSPGFILQTAVTVAILSLTYFLIGI